MYPNGDDVFYKVNATPGPHEEGLGFSLRQRPRDFHRVGSRLEIDLDKDGTPERFHQCASYEGVHLIVWSGEPLKGRERWHRYYYVPYDTEPTCWQDSTGTSPDQD